MTWDAILYPRRCLEAPGVRWGPVSNPAPHHARWPEGGVRLSSYGISRASTCTNVLHSVSHSETGDRLRVTPSSPVDDCGRRWHVASCPGQRGAGGAGGYPVTRGGSINGQRCLRATTPAAAVADHSRGSGKAEVFHQDHSAVRQPRPIRTSAEGLIPLTTHLDRGSGEL